MNRFIKKANTRLSLGSVAALLVGVGAMGSLLGFLRTSLINSNFGPVAAAPFFVAFKIPDFIFFAFASGALGVAFLPVLADHMGDGDKKRAWELSSSLLNFLGLVTGTFSLILIIFAEPLIRTVFNTNHLGGADIHTTATIMRLVALNPFIFAVSSVLTSVQQAYGRFFFYAIAPLFYNIAIIASIFLFKNTLGITGLGVGVFIGSLIQLLIAVLGLSGMNFKYDYKIRWKNPSFRNVLRALPARSIDQGIDYINSIVETRFALGLGPQYVTFYENAFILHTQPISLIGIAISTAAFPRFTERLSQGRPDLFRKEFLDILRAMIWIAMPVVVVSYFARGYLARMIFKHDAREIAVIFGFLAVAIFFRTLYAIISRYFYAQKDTLTPLVVSLAAIGLNIYLAYNLSRPERYGVSGLALAQSTVATAEVIILFSIMLKRDHKLFNKAFWGGVLRIVSVSGFSALTAYLAVSLFPLTAYDRGFVLLTKLSAITLATAAVHIGLSAVYGLSEAKPIIEKLRKIILKPLQLQ